MQGRPGLAEWCARACDASSGCTAVSLHAGRRTCTLHGPTSARAESVDGAADRSTRDTVRKRPCVQAGVPKWECLRERAKWECRSGSAEVGVDLSGRGLSGIRYGSMCMCAQAGARGCAMRAHRCFAQITAADGTQGVVCMVKPQAAVRSSRSGHFTRTPTGKRSAAQHGTTKECHEPMKPTVLAF